MYRYVFHWLLCFTNHIHFYKSALQIQILLVLLAVPQKQRKHDDFSVGEMRPVWPVSSAQELNMFQSVQNHGLVRIDVSKVFSQFIHHS